MNDHATAPAPPTESANGTGGDPGGDPGGEPGEVRPRRRVPRWAVAGIAVFVSYAALGAGERWWTSPTLFQDYDGGSFRAAPVPLEELPFYIGLAQPPQGSADEVITVHGAHANFAPNTAGARGAFAVCTRRPVPEGYLVLGFTRAEDPPEKYCTDLRPIKPGTKMTIDTTGAQYLVLTVTATDPGRIRLESVDLDYTRGWRHLRQHGTQRLLQDVTIPVR